MSALSKLILHVPGFHVWCPTGRELAKSVHVICSDEI